jgi:uncharacterized membrane protein
MVALAVTVAVTVAVNLKRRRRWRLFWVRFVAACTGHPARLLTAPSLSLAGRSNDPWLICCEAKPAAKFNKTA